ncbi:MAG: vitamin K epoxide reductase family protein [Phycisphaeraceae bacterium]
MAELPESTTDPAVVYAYAHREGRNLAGGTELERFLRRRDTPCPGCGYNLRDLVIEHCPHCNEPVSVELLTAAEYQVIAPGALWTLRGAALVAMLTAIYTALVPVESGLFPEQCARVLDSDAATTFGVPVGVPGALLHAALLVGSVFVGYRWPIARRRTVWLAVSTLGLVGLGATLWLIALQVAVVGVLCDLCFWPNLFSVIACATAFAKGSLGVALRFGASAEGPMGASVQQVNLGITAACLLIVLFAIGQVIA